MSRIPLVSDSSFSSSADNFMATTADVFPILDLPHVVIEKIIDFLPPSTCLRLRRVCKLTHDWIANKPWTVEDLEKWKRVALRISGGGFRTFGSVAKLRLPITAFHIQNDLSKQKIYESEGIDQFVEVYKGLTLSLSVDTLFMFQCSGEQLFYSSLTNIQELKIFKLRSCVSIPLPNGAPNDDNFLRSVYWSPPANLINSLRALTIKDCEYSSLLPQHLSDEFILSFLSSFINLEMLCPPAKLIKMRETFPWNLFVRKRTYCPTWTSDLGTAVVKNSWTNRNVYIDLRAFAKRQFTERAYLTYVENYLTFLQEAHRRDFLLRFVYSPILECMYTHWQTLGWSINEIQQPLQFLDNVVSIYGVGNVLLYGFSKMKNLEEISFFHDFASQQWLNYSPSELSWKSLKALKVSVYIVDEALSETGKEVWDLTFQRAFENRNRKSVTSLLLKVSMRAGVQDDEKLLELHETLFNVRTITQNFTALKALTICGWNAPTSVFELLFSGLQNLKYLNIAACSRLTDEVFLHVPASLKTLILKLDEMPLISEVLFSHIVCHMPLRELRIIAKKPLPQITNRAMQALQEGVFGETVEVFPFGTWKSKYINDKGKMAWRKGFRYLF